METKEIEFEKLRYAYTVVKSFLETESGFKVASLETKVENDLLLSGDDNLELLEKFIKTFELNYNDFNYSKHFYSENEIFNPGFILTRFLTFSVRLPLKTIELLTFNKIHFEKPDFHTIEPERDDLTFRELLTWYIEKDYKPQGTVKYIIKT